MGVNTYCISLEGVYEQPFKNNLFQRIFYTIEALHLVDLPLQQSYKSAGKEFSIGMKLPFFVQKYRFSSLFLKLHYYVQFFIYRQTDLGEDVRAE